MDAQVHLNSYLGYFPNTVAGIDIECFGVVKKLAIMCIRVFDSQHSFGTSLIGYHCLAIYLYSQLLMPPFCSQISQRKWGLVRAALTFLGDAI